MTDQQIDQAATAEIAVADLHFPECLRWRDGELFFADMYGDRVHALDPATGALRTVAEVFHPAGIGWLPDGRMLAVASEDRQILEVGAAGNQPYADLSGIAPGWVNDMLVDADGRIYAGNFGYDLFDDEPRPTQMIVVQPDGSAALQADDVVFPNGEAKLSDGRLVVAETFGKCLTTFRVAADGTLSREAAIPLGDTTPDGICVDAEDHLWVTTVSTSEVLRVALTGEVVERHAVRQPSFDCMLGGGDGRTLFVATSPDYEPADRRARAEGLIETLRVDVPGPV